MEFGKYGIEIDKIPVFNIGDISQKVSSLSSNTDAILILTDNTIVSAIDLIIKKCNQNGITMIASDLDSGTKGAALAIGVNERSYGEMAGMQAAKIFKEKISANKIPFAANNVKRIQINTKTMKLQKLNVPKNMLIMAELGQTEEANKI